MAFARYLDDATIGALNKAHSDGEPWWCNLLTDPDIFLAVRRNVLNAYYRGCSLFEIKLDGGALRTTTHYKYLLKPNLVDAYAKGTNGRLQAFNFADAFITDLSDLASIKRAARPFAGGEKSFVADVIASSDNVFDVEVALRREPDESDGRAAADRLDIAALSLRDGRVVLTFYEAKLFGNKELRASSAGLNVEPAVVRQMEGYTKLLSNYSEELVTAYKQAARALRQLNGLSEARLRWAQAVDAANELVINTVPELLIGDFDADQKHGDVWNTHLQKLEAMLPYKTLKARGSGKGLRLKAGDGPLA